MIFYIILAVVAIGIVVAVILGTRDYDLAFGALCGAFALAIGLFVTALYMAIVAFSTAESNNTVVDKSQSLGSFQQYAGATADPKTDRYVELRTTYGPEQKAQIVLKDRDGWKLVKVDSELVVVKYGDTPSVEVRHYRSIHPLLAPFDTQEYPALYVVTIPKTTNSVEFTSSEGAVR